MSLRALPVAHPRRTVAVAAHDACCREPRIDTVLRAGLALSTADGSLTNGFVFDTLGRLISGPGTKPGNWIKKYLLPRYRVAKASWLLDKEDGVKEQLAYFNLRLKDARPEHDDPTKYDPEYWAGPETLTGTLEDLSRELEDIREKLAVQEQDLKKYPEIAKQWAAVAKARQESWTATHLKSKDKEAKQAELSNAQNALNKSLEEFEKQNSSLLPRLWDGQ